MLDRAEINRALAKALAYEAAGKRDEAREYAGRVVEMLRDAGLVSVIYTRERDR